MTLFEYDNLYRDRFGPLLCGVDEAGRGPLAGPVVAAAVILPPNLDPALLEGLNDSKKMTPARREEMYPVLCELALCYGIGQASHQEIDELNILQASLLAMQRAVDRIPIEPNLVMVDGNRLPRLRHPMRDIIRGDSNSAVIAAASVLAKVTRDRLMLELSEQYPQYAFEQHKGYPTKLHYERLDQYGPCDIHRQTFLKKWAANGSPKGKTPQQQLGDFGEQVAAAHLEQQGYIIVCRNLRCGGGEIDIVAQKEDLTLFVEVKTRSRVSSAYGRPVDAVDLNKRRRFASAVEAYIAASGLKTHVRVDVIEVLVKKSGGIWHVNALNQIENPVWELQYK